MMDQPFKLGQEFWLEGGQCERETVECPMCCGTKRVTVQIGTGETFSIECSECSVGYKGSRGVIEQYVVTPQASSFVIEAVVEWRADEWTVQAADGRTARFSKLHSTEAAALQESMERAKRLEDRNMEQLRSEKYGKACTWTIQYHRKQIKKYEEKIEWHLDKIRMKP